MTAVAKACAVVVAVVVMMMLLTACTDEFKASCEARGGEVHSKTHVTTGTGVNPSTGQPVVVTTPTTVRFCVVDGAVVDIA